MKLHFDGHGMNDEQGQRILTFSDSMKWDENGRRRPECEQIAALIEAAPDLLKALVDCEARLALLVASGRSKMLDAVATWHARATIKKAKGE